MFSPLFFFSLAVAEVERLILWPASAAIADGAVESYYILLLMICMANVTAF